MKTLTHWHMLATAVSWAWVVLLTSIFFVALLDDSYQVTVTFNEFSEVWVELALFPLVLALQTWNLIDRWRRFKRQREAKEWRLRKRAEVERLEKEYSHRRSEQ